MNIKNLEHFVAQENNWAKFFGREPLSLLNAEDRQAIAESIDAALSPENLTCDGELPADEVRRRFKYLTRVAEELRSIDPAVKFYEF